MSEPTNEERAEWARTAANAFAAETRYDPREQVISVTGPDDTEGKDNAKEILSDLLCDTRHLCNVLGISFNEILGRSLSDYTEDIAEEVNRTKGDTGVTTDEIMDLLEPSWGWGSDPK